MQPRIRGAGSSPPHLLRLHREALRGCQVQALDRAHVQIVGDDAPLVYQGEWSEGSVRSWRGDVASPLSARLIAAPESERLQPGLRQRDEVTLVQTEPPLISTAEAGRDAHPIGKDERDLVDTCESDTTLDDPSASSREPVVGVVVDRQLVAVSHSSRRTAETREPAITSPRHNRSRAYGLVSTARWTATMQDEGLVPIDGALADNMSSLPLANAAEYRVSASGIAIVPDVS